MVGQPVSHMTRAITTAKELLQAGDIGRCELIRGKLRMVLPADCQHGRTAALLAALSADM